MIAKAVYNTFNVQRRLIGRPTHRQIGPQRINLGVMRQLLFWLLMPRSRVEFIAEDGGRASMRLRNGDARNDTAAAIPVEKLNASNDD